MNGSTMFETASARTTSFDRPSSLRPNLDFGRSAWTNDRNGWNSGTAGADKNTSPDSTRSKIVLTGKEQPTDAVEAPAQLQSSTSSAKFGRLSNNAPLTPVDNPRSSTTSTAVGWGISTTQASDSRLRSQLTSPTKQVPSSWLFKEPLDVDTENYTLLAGSAPEIDLAENRFRRDSRPSTRGFYGPENHSAFNSDPTGHLTTRAFTTTMHPNFTPAQTKPASNRSAGAFPNAQHGMASNDASPTSRSFHSGSSLRNVDTSISPTLSRFNKQAGFDAYMNGSGPGSSAMLEPLTRNFEGFGFGHRAPATNNDLPANHFGVDFVPAIPNSTTIHPGDITPPNLRPTDGYQSSGLTAYYPPSFQPSHSHTHSGHQQSIWNCHDQDLQGPVTSDYKQSLGSPYYSATGTPPTGPESIRSAGGSGISSRTSHHDISLVDRKLRSLDLLHPYQTLATNGFLPVPSTGYDLSMHQSTMRMNPLAAPYHVANNGTYGYGYNTSLRLPPKESVQAHVIRSAVLEEFRMSNKTNKRYELREIFEHVVEFSGDQHGSRFIQLKLETANSDEKDQIFKEIQPNSLQLMTDVFGNYVIQKLFEHGSQSQKKVLANHMRGHVLALSTQMYGCRVVQKAIEHVLTDQQAVIVKELDGPNKQILKVIRDQNGNHVVQKAIERVPAEHIQFIIEAHRGEVVRLATHTYGCRVIQRILEHCQPAGKRVILDELHGCVAPLITDSFGNYVVQHVIQNGELDDRRRVVSIVQQQLLIFSKHKFASNVVEKCIEYADDDQRAEIVRKLVGHNEQGQSPVLGLLRDQYGNYVIQRIHSVIRGAELEALTNEMKLSFPQLKRTSYGKQVLAIEKLLSGTGCPQSAAGDSPTSSTEVSGQQYGRSEYLPSTPSYLPGAAQGQGHLPGHSPMIMAEQH